jgi:diguanylate cyclase (GGDEF)-like protein
MALSGESGECGGAATGLRRRGRASVVYALAGIAWAFAAWFIADRLVADATERRLEREQADVSASAASIGAHTGFVLAQLRNIPKVLAIDPGIVRILSRMGPFVTQNIQPPRVFRQELERQDALRELAARLERTVEELGVDQIWVINAAGDCIASGGFSPEASATGVNYADREYFLFAKRDGISQQFAVGRTTFTPGIYHAAAVFSGQRFLGVVAVKISTTQLARLVSDSRSFITDENGVVVAAGDADLLMKAIPGNTLAHLSNRQRLSRYRRDAFAPLTIEPVEVDGLRLQRLAGRAEPMLSAASGNRVDTLRVWVFRDVSELTRRRGYFVGLYGLLLFGGESLLAAVAVRMNALRRSREHQSEMARINAELVKLNEELRVQACFDALTGCCNRRHFLGILDDELKRAERFDQPCSLAIVDIDHFKEVNDRHGHAAGDALLRQLVRAVGSCLRASDALGRLGGEEFALLLPQTELAGAHDVAERLRRAVEAVRVEHSGVELRMTVSVGVDQWRGTGDLAEHLMARADAAMYAAKRAGRNRVAIADAAPQTTRCP